MPSSTLGGPTILKKPALRWLFLYLPQSPVWARVCGDLRGKKPQNGHPARTENGDRGLVHPCHRCLSARQCHTFTVTQRQKLFGRISASSASTVYAKKQPSNRNSTAGTFAKPVRKIVLEWNLGVINCRIENSTFINVTPSTETMPTEAPAYPVDAVNRVKRLHERAAYDHATVHAILDAAALAHVAYVIDGQPYCTPTLFWREGHRLYWHGSSASRMLRHQATGVPVCVTVSHLDSLVLARCGFNHSVDYRSVMAFGHAVLVSDPDEKRKALTMMVDRFYPGRTANLRPTSDQEFKATAVMAMDIERASAKVRTKGLADEPEDQNLPIYAERIPVFTVLGAPQPCPDLTPDIARPAGLAPYQEGRRLDEALTEAHKIAYDAPH